MTTTDQLPILTREPDREVVAEGRIGDIPWVALRAPLYGAVNGYVRVPTDHPWLSEGVMLGALDMNPDGTCEATYGEGNWIGFDTMHHVNYWPGGPVGFFPDEGMIRMTDDLAIEWTIGCAKNAQKLVDNGTYDSREITMTDKPEYGQKAEHGERTFREVQAERDATMTEAEREEYQRGYEAAGYDIEQAEAAYRAMANDPEFQSARRRPARTPAPDLRPLYGCAAITLAVLLGLAAIILAIRW